MESFSGITMNPDVRFGKPCVSGTRMDVATIVGVIAAGETVETVAAEYQLSIEQVRAALAYAAHVAAHLPPAVRQASWKFSSTRISRSLVHRLRDGGYDADHVITPGWRGASDARIAERLVDTDVLFLTQDEDFLFARGLAAVIVLSRVKQARPWSERIDIWRSAIRRLGENPDGRRFELLDDGSLIPWDEGPQNSWVARAPRR